MPGDRDGGHPFAWAGCDDEASACARVATTADAAGVPTASAGTAIVDALRTLGSGRVALYATYYQPDWREAWRQIVEKCGFDVVVCRNMADEGTAGPVADGDDGWDMGPELMRVAVERAAIHRDEFDALVVTGAGCRTSSSIEDLESLAGDPVVGAATALFRAVARLAGLELRPDSLGRLTEAALP